MWLALLIACGVIGFPPRVQAREVELRLSDGRVIRGELVEEAADEVVLSISGIRTPFDRSVIESIRSRRSIDDVYRNRRAALDDEDLEGRYALARDLFEERAYRLAREELADLRERFPHSEPVAAMLNAVDARIKLAEARADAESPGDGESASPTGGTDQAGRTATGDAVADDGIGSAGEEDSGHGDGGVSAPSSRATDSVGDGADERLDLPRLADTRAAEEPDPEAAAAVPSAPDDPHDRRPVAPGLLSPFEINLIKVWELPADVLEAKPTVRVPRETMARLFAEYGDDPRVPDGRAEQFRMLRRPHYEQLDMLFQVQARSLYETVLVNGDPEPLVRFKREVYRLYVARYFRDHFGRGQIPGLRLRNPLGPAQFYTNFYILSTTEIDGRPMIDRFTPEASLLLQWGLPREAADAPAPPVYGWRPYFEGPEDPRFLRCVAALEGLQSPRPQYGIRRSLAATGSQPSDAPPPAPESAAAPRTLEP